MFFLIYCCRPDMDGKQSHRPCLQMVYKVYVAVQAGFVSDN